VQQIDAQRSIDLSYYGYRLIDPGFAQKSPRQMTYGAQQKKRPRSFGRGLLCSA